MVSKSFPIVVLTLIGISILTGPHSYALGQSSRAAVKDSVQDTVPDVRKTGLNPLMFTNIKLTTSQIDSLHTLNVAFRKLEHALFDKPLPNTKSGDSISVKLQILHDQLIEQERLTYRDVLDSAQKVQYDRNASEVMLTWAKQHSPDAKQTAKHDSAAVKLDSAVHSKQ